MDVFAHDLSGSVLFGLPCSAGAPEGAEPVFVSDCKAEARDKQAIVRVYLKRLGEKYYQRRQYCNQKSFKSGVE